MRFCPQNVMLHFVPRKKKEKRIKIKLRSCFYSEVNFLNFFQNIALSDYTRYFLPFLTEVNLKNV